MIKYEHYPVRESIFVSFSDKPNGWMESDTVHTKSIFIEQPNGETVLKANEKYCVIFKKKKR